MERQKEKFYVRSQDMDHGQKVDQKTTLWVRNLGFQWVMEKEETVQDIKSSNEKVPRVVIEKF